MQQATPRPLCASDIPAEVRAWLPAEFSLHPLPEGDPENTALVAGEPVGGDAPRFVIKRARGVPYAEWIEVEARALEALAPTSLPVPRVVGVRGTKPDSEDAWLVTSALPGGPLSRALATADPVERRSWCDRLGRMLARIHGTPIPAALRSVDATPWERRRHDRLPAERADEALASAQIDRRRPPAPRVLVHGDFTPDNVLCEGDRIVGVIDWPGAGTGDPGYDVATALLSLGGGGRQGEITAFVAAYLEELARRDPSVRDHFDVDPGDR